MMISAIVAVLARRIATLRLCKSSDSFHDVVQTMASSTRVRLDTGEQ